MSKQEERYYWGTVNKITKNGGDKARAEEAAFAALKNKRSKPEGDGLGRK